MRSLHCVRLSAAAASLAAILALGPRAFAAAQAVPEIVAPLPAPTGTFPVATAVAYLHDSTRSDADFAAGRPVTLQLWYPAAGDVASDRVATAPYLMERGLGTALQRLEYYGVDSAALRAWTTIDTHSRMGGAPARGRHPLLAFSVGLGVARANYTSLAEELASWGYVVALVESPLQGLMLLPDGREVMDSAGRYGDPAGHRLGVDSWSRDVSFALDRLRGRGSPPEIASVAAGIDWSRVGALGHSTGGLVAIAACERDGRIRACVNMDGGVAAPDRSPLADFVTKGLSKPALFLRSQPLYDDTTLTRRGLTREQWEQRGAAGRAGIEALVKRSSGFLSVAYVAGTGHFSFSDAPFVMPSAISRFGGRIIGAGRGWSVITRTLRAFFDQELGGRRGALAALAKEVPELTVAAGGM